MSFIVTLQGGPNFFKPQTRPLLENLINIVVGGTLALQNALKADLYVLGAHTSPN